MALRSDYAGAFDPEVGLESFSRQALARLGREYLLNGHLQDRVGLPLVAKRFGGDSYVRVRDRRVDGREPDLLPPDAARAGVRGSRRRDGLQEPPARHRRPAPVHGLPVPPRPARLRRVLAPALRGAARRRALRRRARQAHVPRHRGSDLRRDRRRGPPLHEDAAHPPTAARAGQVTTPPAAGRSSSATKPSRTEQHREPRARAALAPGWRSRTDRRAG